MEFVTTLALAAMPSISVIVWTSFAVLLAALVWEYRVVDSDTNWRPSYPLECVASFFIEVFTRIGRAVAWVCSFYKYIEWKKMWKALCRFFGPIFDIALSWMWMFKGYAQFAYDYAIEIPLLHLGFATIVAVLFVIAWYWIPAAWWPDLPATTSRVGSGQRGFVGSGGSGVPPRDMPLTGGGYKVGQ